MAILFLVAAVRLSSHLPQLFLFVTGSAVSSSKMDQLQLSSLFVSPLPIVSGNLDMLGHSPELHH